MTKRTRRTHSAAFKVDRISSASNIEERMCAEVTALAGSDVLQEITLTDVRTGGQCTVSTNWLFVCIGGVPQTEWAQEVGIVRDEGGYLVTGPDLQEYRANLKWPLERAPSATLIRARLRAPVRGARS
ncbi:hypothetical protein PQR02_38690 [Paraburkholderia sediminicola]|uniref:Uncharacterized protein n=1 Tax=Paraburkholderia rhynchosiae TaxID=487049 RepID=A0ACC7NNQ6_9BURK